MTDYPKSLIGKKVVDIKQTPQEELDTLGWSGRTVPCIVFDDGSYIYASVDEEGNAPGTLFGVDSLGDGFFIFLEDGEK